MPGASSSADSRSTIIALPEQMPAWVAAAGVAVAFPTLLAYNFPPSATFLNQAIALIGWAGLLIVIATRLGAGALALDNGLAALLGALTLLAISALAAPLWAALPWALALSALGTILPTLLVVMAGAAVGRSELRQPVWCALCMAMVAAGVLGTAIGIVQVFLPEWADGNWLAAASLAGRASGNLRQPNHLSSLLLWSVIAVVWLGESGVLRRGIALALGGLLVFGIVLSASRTGIVGIVLLALWGALDRRLSRSTRIALLVTPLLYWLCWLGLTAWAHQSHQVFAGETHIAAESDISSSRFKIWSDTLALIAQHPWLGVGFGEFNFAWSLTPFPHRPVAFFDHTHNLPLQFAVELGLPLAALVLTLLCYALWRAFAAGRDARGPDATLLRAAFMMVLMMAVHSQLEYPLWYAYFLLPTAFAFGLCLGGGAARIALPLRGFRLAAMLMLAGSLWSVFDYMRVVVIFAPPAEAAPLEERIASGQRSWFFAHHADYAAATTFEHPSQAMPSFKVATHYLLDTRLMMAWATALHEAGDDERARHIAQRLREFRNEDSKSFFEPCDARPAPAEPLPFQCTPPTRAMDYRDFR